MTEGQWKELKSHEKQTDPQNDSLLTMFQDETEGLNTCKNWFQAPKMWMEAINDPKKCFHPELESKQGKNHLACFDKDDL